MTKHRSYILYLIKIVCCATALLLLPLAAGASFPEEALQEIRELVTDQSEYYNDVRAELSLIDPADWSIEQTHKYLDTSLWTVYYGLNYYFKQNGSLPGELSSLAGTTYIPLWPANPYNDWAPMNVLTLEDGFLPGELTRQVCPPEFYSYVKNTRPVSCELCIFGPTIEYGELNDAAPMKSNTWAETPEGAVFMVGQFAEPSEAARRKFEEIEGGK